MSSTGTRMNYAPPVEPEPSYMHGVNTHSAPRMHVHITVTGSRRMQKFTQHLAARVNGITGRHVYVRGPARSGWRVWMQTYDIMFSFTTMTHYYIVWGFMSRIASACEIHSMNMRTCVRISCACN